MNCFKNCANNDRHQQPEANSKQLVANGQFIENNIAHWGGFAKLSFKEN